MSVGLQKDRYEGVAASGTSIWWNTSWPIPDEEACEYRFHILTAALACPSSKSYVHVEVGAGFGYWTGTHLMALQRFHPHLLNHVQIHVVDSTPTVDDCLRTHFASNHFDIPPDRIFSQRAFLNDTRSGNAYLQCQQRMRPSPQHSCLFTTSGLRAGQRSPCNGNMADVLALIPGEIDVIDVDIQGFEGLAITSEAKQMMEQRVKAAFIAPHDKHVRQGSHEHNMVMELYNTFSTGVWRSICLQHPTDGSAKSATVCDGVVASLNTHFYDVTDVNNTYVRVTPKCNSLHAIVIPLMNPFTSWPHWKEPTVERDPVYRLWGSTWSGRLEVGEAVSFMGLKFPQKLMPSAYRGALYCYRDKADWLGKQLNAFKPTKSGVGAKVL